MRSDIKKPQPNRCLFVGASWQRTNIAREVICIKTLYGEVSPPSSNQSAAQIGEQLRNIFFILLNTYIATQTQYATKSKDEYV